MDFMDYTYFTFDRPSDSTRAWQS